MFNTKPMNEDDGTQTVVFLWERGDNFSRQTHEEIIASYVETCEERAKELGWKFCFFILEDEEDILGWVSRLELLPEAIAEAFEDSTLEEPIALWYTDEFREKYHSNLVSIMYLRKLQERTLQ